VFIMDTGARAPANINSQQSGNNLSTNNPLWSLFLESSCSSASVFFKLHLSTRSYFHSPTPWTNPNSNISRKVARLLDSFKPGSTSYCPFPNEEDNSNLSQGTARPQSNDGNEESNPRPALVRPSDVSVTPTSNINIQENVTSTRENQDRATSSEEEMRRRLYLNVGRPRPFYRVPSASSSPETQSFSEQNSVFRYQSNPINKTKTKAARTLQELVRNFFVSKYGLENLSGIVKNGELFLQLPPSIKYYLLTFPCSDFEEIGSERPASAASYHVRCKLDSRKYSAIFATSEMDKAIYNVWKDKEDWLQSIEGVQDVLATTVDAVTENIFYIIEDDFMTLSEFLKKSDETLNDIFALDKNGREDEIQELGERVERILRQIETMRLTFILSSVDQILVKGNNIVLQNPLLTKRLLGDESCCSMNYHQLATIMRDLLGCDNLCNSPDDCLTGEEPEVPSPRHGVYTRIAQLSTQAVNQDIKKS